ncbi:MAG: flagellar protein FlgN [Actinobacteria bacterium]|nr:flagellar protein FlgN [Actinomycetota bacterium]
MTAELVQHLTRQIRSAKRLLEIVVAQGAAIRARDVDGVLARLAELQGEMAQRLVLEQERERLIAGVATRLGVRPDEVDIEAVLALEPAVDGSEARRLSAELKGLVDETARLHGQNQVLIRQELSFLDHLMRLLSGAWQAGYSPTGMTRAPQTSNAVNAVA